MASEISKEKAVEAGDLKYRLFPSARLALVVLVGIGQGVMMITRFNINIAVVCMADSDGGPPLSATLEPPLQEGLAGGGPPLSATLEPPLQEGLAGGRPPLSATLEPPLQEGLAGGGAGTPKNTTLVPPLQQSVVNETGGWENDKPEEFSGQGEFQWDKTFQGLLLSSYFYGYTAGLAPGGWLADRLPVVLVLLFGVCSQGVCTLAIPVVARANAHLLLALRALQGLCCSAVLPAASVFARNWSGPVEYATVFGICWSFQYLLGGAAYPLSSALCQAAGWPMVFYVTGALPLLWVVIAWFLLTSSPDESSICSEEEKRYLASKRLCRVATTKSLSDKDVKRPPTPILAMITNRQVLILVATFFCNSWFYYALNITLPTFLKETMGVNLTENGFLSGLPTMSMTLGVLLGGRVIQYLLTRWQLSLTNARKIVATVSMLIPAGLLGAILLLPPGSTYLTMALLTICNVTAVLGVSGGPLSAGPDIAPQFAGIIWGLAGSVGNVTGVLAPIIAAAMTPNKTLLEWRYFFLITLVLNVTVDLIILLFWKSEVQPFAKADQNEEQTQSGSTCRA